jgi:hypothetical protein
MMTRSLDLDYAQMNVLDCGSSSKEGAAICLVAMGVIIPIGSFVASGSIVLVGNTLHWLEYHGACDEGLLWSYIEERK